MTDRPEPRCHDRAWLFTSVDRRDHETARRECLGTDGAGPCPMLTACEAMLRDFQASPWQSGLHGTWAGRLYGSKGLAREHGTDRGYHQHRYAREPKCEPCKAAHAEAQRGTSHHKRKAA